MRRSLSLSLLLCATLTLASPLLAYAQEQDAEPAAEQVQMSVNTQGDATTDTSLIADNPSDADDAPATDDSLQTGQTDAQLDTTEQALPLPTDTEPTIEEQPAEQPAEQSAEVPAEQPAEEPDTASQVPEAEAQVPGPEQPQAPSQSSLDNPAPDSPTQDLEPIESAPSNAPYEDSCDVAPTTSPNTSTDQPSSPTHATADSPADQPSSPARASAAIPADQAGSSALATPSSSITTTTVVVMSPGSSSKVATVKGASSANGATILLLASHSSASQRFRIQPIAGTSYCLLYNVLSNKVLTVKGAKAAKGTAIVQQSAANTAAQQWIVHADKGGRYALYTTLACSGKTRLVLGYRASTGYLQLQSEAATSTNRWKLTNTRTVANGVYRIASSVSSSRSLTVAKASLANGANVQSYKSNTSNGQRFLVSYNTTTGYYTIVNVASGMALSVANPSKTAGANVHQSNYRGSAGQQWSIERHALGGYRLVSRVSGHSLSVQGASTASGANVCQAKSANSKAQKWTFSSVAPLAEGIYQFCTASKPALAVHVHGGFADPYTNVLLSKTSSSTAQRFELVQYAKGLYTVRNISNGLYLSIRSASAKPKVDIDMENALTVNDGMLWRIVAKPGGLSLVSASGMALSANGSLKQGTNLWSYTPSRTTSQRFVSKKQPGGKLGITQLAGLVSTQTNDDVLVRSSCINGVTYLFLPSCVNSKSVRLGYLSTKQGKAAQLSTAKNGSYRTLSQLGTVNLSSYKKDANGAYLLWLRTAGTNDAHAVRVMISQNLRSLYLTSDKPASQGRRWVEASTHHTNSTTGSMVLLGVKGDVIYDGALSQIKGRGNSTWTMPKKPYQIKLVKKASLLDGSSENKAKTWVLLANYLDTSLERDYLAKKLGKEMGLAATPDSEFVDLFYDGIYRGTYLLGEKVQIGSGRVDIYDLEEANEDLNGDTSSHATARGKNSFGQVFQYVTGIKNPSDITGGYLLEMDNGNYNDERCWFKTTAGYFVIKGPEDASYEQVKYISEYVQRTVNAAGKVDGDLSQYIDLSSLAKTTLVNEVAKNPDWLVWSSTFYYKDKGSSSVLKAGPLWDFDLAFGVARQDETVKYSHMAVEGLNHVQYGFYGANKQFISAFKNAYTTYAKSIKALSSGGSSGKGAIGDTAATLKRSWVMNRTLWPYKSTVYVPLKLSSRENAVEHLWYWTAARTNWLNWYFTGSSAPVVSLDSALSGTYTLKAGTGRMLNVTSGSSASGANIETWKSNGSNAQKFTLKAMGRANTGEWYYRIVNVGSGKVLAAQDGATALCTNVCQVSPSNSTAQYWILRRTSTSGEARYQIVNLKSRLALDVGGAENRDGANVLLYLVCGNNASQNWYLKKQ